MTHVSEKAPALFCPICKKPVRARSENPAFPFCTPRCKMVDLGKWVNEEYRMPAEDADDDPEAPLPSTDDDQGKLH